MSTLLDLEGNAEVDVDTVRADSSDMLNGAGSSTGEYNDTDGDANGTTYLRTNLSRVDDCQVSVHTQDGAISTSSVGVQVVAARPAQASDFNSNDDFVDGTILIQVADEDGSGEISDDTSIDSNDLTFSYTAVRE